MDNLARMDQPPDMSMLPGITLPSGIAFSLDIVAPASRFIFRGSAQAAEQASRGFGVPLPRTACEAAHTEDCAALWLGPDEWLLLDFEMQTQDRAAALQSALQHTPHSLVDISQRQIGLAVTGARAARALSAGCPLDFYRTAFPIDMVARTVFMKAEIIIWRRAETHFHVEIGRSFADYCVRHLIDAARHAPIE